MNNERDSKELNVTRWAFGVLGMTVVCYLANALLGPLNQDEGWYLYAARQVMDGQLPHFDFFFTQGKLMPLLYAGFGWMWSFAGIFGGRLFTALLSLIALFIAQRTVARCAPQQTRFQRMGLLVAFLGLNLWYTYFTTIPKTYGICTLGLAIAFNLLTQVNSKQTLKNCLLGMLSGAIFAGLADIRWSMGILLPLVASWLFFNRKRMGRWTWGYFSIAAGGVLLGAFLPELLFCREQFLEAVTFHGARESIGVVGVIGCFARVLRFNPLLCFMGVLLGWQWLTQKDIRDEALGDQSAFAQLWLLSAFALTVVHVIAPVPYDDYLIPAVFLLAMGVATLSTHWMSISLTKVCVVTAFLLSICGSSIAQDWVIAGQDRFWVKQKAMPDLFLLWKVAHQVRQLAADVNEDTLWTQDTYLAVEAGLKVPKGMEMGPFSKPVTLDTLPKIAAWSGYTYALTYPSLAPAFDRDAKIEALEAIYGRTILTVPAFGQGGTQLTVAERIMP